MMKVQLSAIPFILALTAGCQSVPSSSGTAEADAVTAQKDNMKFSGFLSDDSQLQPASDREGVLFFIDKSANYRPYSKVMFAPVQVYVMANPEYNDQPLA